MTTLSKFFDTILPTVGLRCIALAKPEGKWHHYWSATNADLMADAAAFDATGETVYFAVSTFRQEGVRRGRPYAQRKQVNAVACRAFILDLDVFDPRDPEPAKRPEYPDQRAAIGAVVLFCKALKLPKPWLVSSGVGIHVYWPMLADMAPELWKGLSEALKRALTAHGILFDPVVTANEAAVLRPPGTTHRKFAPLPVRILLEGDVSDVADFAQAVLPWIVAPSSPAPIGTAKLSAANSALGGGLEFEPSSADQVADLCGVIGHIRDTLGRVDQPTWYYGLGVLLHTEQAPDVCHDWSKGDPRYSAKEVDDNLARLANHGATSCEKLAEFQPDICAACQFRGQIKSPIVLGRARYTPAPQTPQAAPGGTGGGAFGGGTAAAGPVSGGGATSSGQDMPSGYRWEMQDGHKVLTYYVPGKDKEPGFWAKFCETFFKPTMRLDFNGERLIEWVMEEVNGDTKTFTMQNSTINKGGQEAAGELGFHGIVTMPNQGRAMDGYLKRWSDRTRHTPLVIAHQSFGWSRGYFVTGNVAIAEDGSESQSVMAGPAKNRQDVVVTKGDLAVWKAAMDRAYNAPGQEVFQFQLVCGFAAPLVSLMQQVQGLTVYAHSAGSGVGKTTVHRAALSIWGNWKEMMLAQNKATINALWGLLGAYNTLPVVYDELTNAKNDEVSDLVFSVSSGRGKERMTTAGEMRDNNSNWSTIMLASGNTTLSDKLAAHRGNAEAEISRLFEFQLEARPHLSVAEANDLFPLIDDHYGHAGLLYARYLVANRPMIVARLAAVRKQVEQLFQIQQVERYWLSLFTAVLVALEITRRLELVAFEPKPLVRWMRDRLEENRGLKTAAIVTYEEHLGIMLNDFGPDLLTTYGVGNKRNMSIIADNGHPRGSIAGRLILPTQNAPDSQLWLSRPRVKEWCQSRGVHYRELLATAVRQQWADPSPEHQLNLTIGTQMDKGGYVRCWKLFPDRMSTAPVLGVIQGGLSGGAAAAQAQP